MLVRIFCDDGG